MTISVAALDHSMRLSVADSGEGIGPDDLARVFDRFYRGDQARARGSGGSGLGLAITYALVEALGGALAVQSQLGAGRTFTVTLPRVTPP